MKRLKRILSKVLEIDEDTITGDTSPDTVESWDSFNGLMLVSELESGFDIKFSIDDIVAVEKVEDIKYYLRKYGVVLEED